jgi:hypothetical protein
MANLCKKRHSGKSLQWEAVVYGSSRHAKTAAMRDWGKERSCDYEHGQDDAEGEGMKQFQCHDEENHELHRKAGIASNQSESRNEMPSQSSRLNFLRREREYQKQGLKFTRRNLKSTSGETINRSSHWP